MGFLRRLLGAPNVQQRELAVSYFTEIRDDAVLEVVGEAYRQGSALEARPPGPGDLPPGLPPPASGQFKAILVREPTNQYDPNAVAVLVWAGRTWTQVGYLARERAGEFAPLFVYLNRGDPTAQRAIACDAARVSERGGMGFILHLGSAGECIVESVTESPAVPSQFTGKMIALTGWGATTLYGVTLDRFAQLRIARWAGCEVVPRLTKKTEALIVADPSQMSGNLQKAREYALPTIPEPEFLQAIGIPREAIGRVTGRWMGPG